MSESKKTSSGNGGNSAGTKRNLPSWMSAREERDSSGGKNKELKSSASASNSGSHDFSKLMEGVVFVLSGFVNPERAELRSRALEMGAEYQPDWNSNCTLLICAFPNTPKFRQVEADSGTVVSKEWILECHEQKKLVDIEPYILHPGKPWRRQSVPNEASNDCRATSSLKLQNVEKSSCTLPTNGASEDRPSNQVSNCFSPSRVKKWAGDDFIRTLSWLESQDEKPEQSEIKKIAAEGILTCLQDAIDALKQGQLILQITEHWACVPRVVEELMKFDGTKDDSASVSKKYLCRHAVACKQIYENEYRNLEDDSSPKKSKTKEHGKCGNEERSASKGGEDYESDDTIEMTEEEIDRAYNTISSTLLDAG